MEVLDRGDMDDIITWLPHGRAFIVVHSQHLKEIVLPRFFKQSKFMSFTRQLNLWGFKRLTNGTDAGAYYHEFFLRGRPLLCNLMRRQKVKGTGIKLTPNPDTEPNFYVISEKRPLPAIPKENKTLLPLPPVNSKIEASMRSSKQLSSKNRNLNDSEYTTGPTISSGVDFYLQQQQMQLGSHPPAYIPSMLPEYRRMSLQDPYQMNMLHPQPLRSFQRLSAPTTQSDLNIAHISMEQRALDSAQRVLSEVNNQHLATYHPPSNPVEDMKQRLLNAVQSLEQAQRLAQAPPTMETPHYSSSAFREYNHYGVTPMHPYPYHSHSILSPHHYSLLGQNPPDGTGNSISALMSALDQTKQVAAAAHAQSNLLQQVANDLALKEQNKKK